MGIKQSDIDRAIADGNKVLAQLKNVCPVPHEIVPAKKKRARQSSKPLLNRLELEWYRRLQDDYPGWSFGLQAIRFRLGNGIWYKPDITRAGLEANVAWEVKGPHSFRGGIENLKVAASLYPEWTWILVWKENNEWVEQKILP